MPPPPMNRWTKVLKQRPSSLSAFAMFAFYIAGSMLVIASSLAALAGLLLVVGAVGSGLGGRLGGVGFILAAVAGFWFGKWAMSQYGVQRRS